MALNDTISALGNAIINLIDKKTPIATANTVGMVKPDGSTINIDANGVISSGTPIYSHPQIVDKYNKGTSWYRVWSDGWIEQGGYAHAGKTPTTVTFLKKFANTNYTITLGTKGTLGVNNNGVCSIPAKATSNFTLYSYSSYYCHWYACGY